MIAEDRNDLSRFSNLYIPVPESGCWLWLGQVSKKGYPFFYVRNASRRIRAHRYAYEMFRGPIQASLVMDHLCRVRCCVNPDHLEAVTNKENLARGVGLASINAKKTHCLRGHLFAGDNLRMEPRGRVCRACKRIRDNKHQEAPHGTDAE